MLTIPKTYVKNIWGLISPNIKKMQILSTLLHNNKDKDEGNNNNSEITKVSTLVISTILLILINHSWEIWS